MMQFLYNLVNWQYFGILAIIWVVVDLVWVGRWKALVGRVGKLVTKPWIFKKDKEPHEPPLYPREFLEQLALNSRRETKTDADSKTSSEAKSETIFEKWAKALMDRVFDTKKPIRSLGYVLALAFFIFFLFADAIVIANTMVLLGLMGNLPPILQRLDLAILGGALLSAIVGVWMLVEMSGTEGELINADTLTDSQKRIFKVLSLIVTLFSAAVMVALAIQRLISLGSLQTSPTMDLIISFILYGLLAINNSLAAALTYQPAASGFMVVMFLLVELVIGILPVLAFLADVLWRGVYIILDLVIWAILTPIIAIPYVIAKMFGWVS